MNLIEKGITALATAMANATESDVTYRRAEQSWTIPATRGGVSFGTVNRVGGIPLEIDYREYIMRTAAFPTGVLPQNRDVILDGTERWEVFNIQGKTCYRYSDPAKTIIRIYTRKL